MLRIRSEASELGKRLDYRLPARRIEVHQKVLVSNELGAYNTSILQVVLAVSCFLIQLNLCYLSSQAWVISLWIIPDSSIARYAICLDVAP